MATPGYQQEIQEWYKHVDYPRVLAVIGDADRSVGATLRVH